MTEQNRKIVLAYSGGLDTSVAIRWLKDLTVRQFWKPPRDRALLKVLAIGSLVLAGVDLFQFYLPVYGHGLNLSASVIGLIMGAFSAASFTMRVLLPPLASLAAPLLLPALLVTTIVALVRVDWRLLRDYAARPLLLLPMLLGSLLLSPLLVAGLLSGLALPDSLRVAMVLVAASAPNRCFMSAMPRTLPLLSHRQK